MNGLDIAVRLAAPVGMLLSGIIYFGVSFNEIRRLRSDLDALKKWRHRADIVLATKGIIVEVDE